MIWPLGSLTLICPLALHTRTRNAGVAAKKVEKVRQKRGGSEGQGKAGMEVDPNISLSLSVSL